MKSRTLSCNGRVFRKNLTRFAPIWVEYSVVLLIISYFFWNQGTQITDRYSWFLGAFAFANAIYGFVCAVSLFGYLTDPRECNTVHAFPVRREEYFLVHLLSGFLMALVPNAVFCLLNLPAAEGGSMWYTFSGMMLEFIFFYGLAIFSMLLTGRKFAAATVYALLNWLSLLVMWAIDTIYLPMLPGVSLNTDIFYQLCPVIRMSFQTPAEGAVFHGVQSQQMQVFLIYAIVGALLMAGSLILYRRRRLEYAGDFIAVKWLTPVFVVALSVAFGCVLAAFGSLFNSNDYILLAVGLLVGYFTGMMLLKKTVKVFNPKTIMGAAAVLAVIFGSIFLTSLDPMNRVNHVPEVNEVASAEIREHDTYSGVYKTEDPQVIADILALHRDILEQDQYEEADSYIRFHVTYRLKNGTSMIRYYALTEEDVQEWAGFYYSQPEFLMDVSTLAQLQETCRVIEINDYRDSDGTERYCELDEEQRMKFTEVFFRECREGKMSTCGDSENPGLNVCIGLGKSINNTHHYWIPIPETAVDTREMAEELLSETP